MNGGVPIVGQGPKQAPPILAQNDNGETYAYPQVACVMLSAEVFTNMVGAISSTVTTAVIAELERRGVITPEPGRG
jgi:hypothetical protein